ncbi:hypothetical protein [Reyranella sp.]|uniref:hypothetical protein n=1 Tax=Reyranella sp. TaxID=1929291 RepID=UPI0037848AD5
MKARRLLNPLDIVRLAMDEYEPTLVAVRAHFDQPTPRMTYGWLYDHVRFAIAPEPGLSDEAVLAGLATLNTKRAQQQNRECYLLSKTLYADKMSRCWPGGEVSLGFGRRHFIPVRPSAIRLDLKERRAAVVVVQPRKSFMPSPDRMGMLGFILSEACVPRARETLFAASPAIDISVEFVNLAPAPGSRERWPRLQRVTDFPVPDVEMIKRRISNLARAIDQVRAENEERRRKAPPQQEPPGPLFE